MNMLEDPRADRNLLEKFHFDLPRWLAQVAEIRHGSVPRLTSTVLGSIEPVASIPSLFLGESADELALRRAGQAALVHGQVAVLIINGGLATRFGGEVKGVVEVSPGRSFLAFKLGDVAHAEQAFRCQIPVVLMNSFATRETTHRHLQQNDFFGLDPRRLFSLDQSISIRLEEDGSPFVGMDGKFHYYAPGHGEFFDLLLQSGLHAQLTAAGVRWLLFSNVDNLGASVEPLLIGHHIRTGVDMTVETTEKRKDTTGQWDVGGAPATIDGRTQVVEGFRFPAEFDQNLLPDFQTNNMLFTLDALTEPFPMPRYLVRKRVDGKDSLAFEAVTCEASGICRRDGRPRLSLGLVRVPRDGTRGRFFPVKSRQDLETMRSALADRVEEGRRLRELEAQDH